MILPFWEGKAARPMRADPALVMDLARAFRYQRLLDEARHASISEMVAAERIERGYLGSLLRLMLLAPDIVEAMLDGRQPKGMTLPALLEPFPGEWTAQRAALTSGAHSSRKDAATHPAAGRVVTRAAGGRG